MTTHLRFTACEQPKLLPTLVETEIVAGSSEAFDTLGCSGAIWVDADGLDRRAYSVSVIRL